MIRNLTADEIPAALPIMRQISEASGIQSIDASLVRILETCTVYVFENVEGIAGLVAVKIVDAPGHPKMATIDAIGVEAKYRRQGLGKVLVHHMQNRLADAGVEIVNLNVAADNAPALSFYRKMGFETKAIYMECRVQR